MHFKLCVVLCPTGIFKLSKILLLASNKSKKYVFQGILSLFHIGRQMSVCHLSWNPRDKFPPNSQKFPNNVLKRGRQMSLTGSPPDSKSKLVGEPKLRMSMRQVPWNQRGKFLFPSASSAGVSFGRFPLFICFLIFSIPSFIVWYLIRSSKYLTYSSIVSKSRHFFSTGEPV